MIAVRSPLGQTTVNAADAFSLIELLTTLVVLAVLGFLALPALQHGLNRGKAVLCRNHLEQWGLATQMYALDHDDYLPPEGSPTPSLRATNTGWYVDLPKILGTRPYHEMPWRTNPVARLAGSLFLCPSNPRRAVNDNLFHYCLNGRIDGTGALDRPIRLSALRHPQRLVWLFDNGKRAAVAQQNNVHTNLHGHGANVGFVDGHVALFRSSDYWDYSADRGRTNNPQLVWQP